VLVIERPKGEDRARLLPARRYAPRSLEVASLSLKVCRQALDALAALDLVPVERVGPLAVSRIVPINGCWDERVRNRGYNVRMCMQCMASAMAAGAAATGMRVWIATHTPAWMTPRRLKLTTAAILAAGVLASGNHLAPNGASPGTQQATIHESGTR